MNCLNLYSNRKNKSQSNFKFSIRYGGYHQMQQEPQYYQNQEPKQQYQQPRYQQQFVQYPSQYQQPPQQEKSVNPSISVTFYISNKTEKRLY